MKCQFFLFPERMPKVLVAEDFQRCLRCQIYSIITISKKIFPCDFSDSASSSSKLLVFCLPGFGCFLRLSLRSLKFFPFMHSGGVMLNLLIPGILTGFLSRLLISCLQGERRPCQ